MKLKKLSKIFSQSKGMSLPEIMISVAILAIIAGAVGYFLSNQKGWMTRLGRSSECDNIAQSVVNSLTEEERTHIINFLPGIPSGALWPTNLTAGRKGVPYYDPASPTAFHNYQNIENDTTLALQLYRNYGPTICNPGVTLSSATVPSLASVLSGNSVTITVQPLDEDGEPIDCDNSIPNIRPTNATTSSSSHGGFLITAKVGYVDPQTQVLRTCENEGKVFYPADTVAPTVSYVGVAGSGVGVTGPINPGPTLCSNGADVNVSVSVNANEPGSLFVCQDTTAKHPVDINDPVLMPDKDDLSKYHYCGDGTNWLNGTHSSSMRLRDSSPNVPTQGSIDFTNLPEEKYTFLLRSVDTASNTSDAVLVTFIVDKTRPIWTAGLTPAEDPGSPGRFVVQTAAQSPLGSLFPLNDRRAQLFTGLFQCNADLFPRFSGTLSTSWGNETCTGTMSDGANVTGTINANQCTLAVDPTRAVSGEYTLTGEARDVCNTSPPSAGPFPPLAAQAIRSVMWTSDTNDIFVTVARPLGARINSAPGVPAPLGASGTWLRAPAPPAYAPAAQGVYFQLDVFPRSGPTYSVRYNRNDPILNNKPIVWDLDHLTNATKKRALLSTGPLMNFSANDFGWSTSDDACDYGNGFSPQGFSPCGKSGTSYDGPFNPAWFPDLSPHGPAVHHFRVAAGDNDRCTEVLCENPSHSCQQIGVNRGTCTSITCGGWKCHNHEDCLIPNSCLGTDTNVDTNPTYNTEIISGIAETIDPFPRVCRPQAGQGRHCAADGDCQTNMGVGRCVAGQCTCPDQYASGFYAGIDAAANTNRICAELAVASANDRTPVCTCDLVSARSTCAPDVFRDSCGVARCKGLKMDSSCISGAIPLVTAHCDQNPAAGWLGKNDQTIQAHGTDGVGPLTVQCYANPADIKGTLGEPDPLTASWRNCTWDQWPESPKQPAGGYTDPVTDPNVRYWVKVTDSRGDWDICEGWYNLDRTNPVWKMPLAKFHDDECGKTQADPTLGSTVKLVDFFTEVTQDSAPVQFYCNGTSNPALRALATEVSPGVFECLAPVDPSPDAGGHKLVIEAVDLASNTTEIPADRNVYAAVRTGMNFAFAPVNAPLSIGTCAHPSVCRIGCKSCSVAPYNIPTAGTITGANALNFMNAIDKNVCAEELTPCTANLKNIVNKKTGIATGGRTFGKVDNNFIFNPGTGLGTYNGDFRFGGEGRRTSFWEMVDQCGNRTFTIPGGFNPAVGDTNWWATRIMVGNTANFDWTPPSIELNVNHSARSITAMADDFVPAVNVRGNRIAGAKESGVSQVGVSCTGTSGSWSAGPVAGSSVTLSGLPKNEEIECTGYAKDVIGNESTFDIHTGKPRGVRRRVIITPPCDNSCAFAASVCNTELITVCAGTPEERVCRGGAAPACELAANVPCNVPYYANNCQGFYCGLGTQNCPPVGPAPSPSPGCTCTDTAAHCSGATYTNSCGAICTGTQAPTCDGSSSYDCQTVSGTCGATCAGALPETCAGIACSLPSTTNDWVGTHRSSEEITSDHCGLKYTGEITCQPINPPCNGNLYCGTLDTCGNTGVCNYICGECGVTCDGEGGCFADSTLIDMADGSQKPIEDIKVGDWVLSFDTQTNNYVEGFVNQLFVHEDKKVTELVLSNGKSYIVTPVHKFYLPLSREWVEVGNLRANDIVLDKDTDLPVQVKAIRKDSVRMRVYNFNVNKYQNYFVNGVLVHNMKNCPGGCIEYNIAE